METTSHEVFEPIPAGTDHFAVLGLGRRLNLDLGALERTYHALSRQYHPDYYASGPPEVRAIAEANTARVTAAYRTLRDPIQRAAYLIELEGAKSGPSAQTERVPQRLLMEAFEARETLEAFEEADKAERAGLAESLREAHGDWRERLGDVETRLWAKFDAWDALAEGGAAGAGQRGMLINEMEILLGEWRYVANLVRDLEAALNGGSA